MKLETAVKRRYNYTPTQSAKIRHEISQYFDLTPDVSKQIDF